MAANPRQPGRFTLADAMVLLAAIAVGLALSRVWTRFANERTTFQSSLYPGPLNWPSPFTTEAVRYWPVVAVLSLTLLVLRTLRPRPVRRRRFAPPGIAACAAASMAMPLQGVLNVLVVLYHAAASGFTWKPIKLDHLDVLNLTLEATGALSSTTASIAVAAVWGTTLLAGRWRPEPSWIDRAGIVVGLLWLALIPIRLHFNLLHPWLSG